jgi:protein-S-isoprenylcysteine O-methyltransferase Ste14
MATRFFHEKPSGNIHAEPDALRKNMNPTLAKIVHISTGLLMASLWGAFAYRHGLAFHQSGQWEYLLIALSETLTATFFLLRSAPETVSSDPLDWLFAIAGTFTPLFFSPSEWGVLPWARHLVMVGMALQIVGMISLNRSFALVAAKRQVKTRGLYRYVRHPLYASYLVMFTGYTLANTTPINVLLYVMTIGFLYVRLVREEKHLAIDTSYAAYMQQVRFRVIPFVF